MPVNGANGAGLGGIEAGLHPVEFNENPLQVFGMRGQKLIEQKAILGRIQAGDAGIERFGGQAALCGKPIKKQRKNLIMDPA